MQKSSLHDELFKRNLLREIITTQETFYDSDDSMYGLDDMGPEPIGLSHLSTQECRFYFGHFRNEMNFGIISGKILIPNRPSSDGI